MYIYIYVYDSNNIQEQWGKNMVKLVKNTTSSLYQLGTLVPMDESLALQVQQDHQLTVGKVRRDAVNLEFSQADLGEGVAEAVLVKVGMDGDGWWLGVMGKCGRGFLRGREGELDGTWVLTDGDMFWYLRTFKPAWFDTAQSHFEKALRLEYYPNISELDYWWICSWPA